MGPAGRFDAGDQDYPRFLGRDGRATVTNVALATDWQTNPPRLLWRQPIGAGWSAFSIVGDYAVTQEQRGRHELVVCYELQTGQIVWSHQDLARFYEVLGGVGPRATPTIEDGRVYTQGATGILNCLELTSGRLIWTRDILAENSAPQIQWGRSGSPLIVDDKVVVSAGGPDGKSLVAYDKMTGARIWSAGDDPSSYASPILTTLAGRRQVVTVNEDHVRGHDVEDGRQLWSFPWPGNSANDANTSQPVPLGANRVFVSKGYLQGCAVFEVRAGTNGEFVTDQVWRSHKSLKTKMSNVVVHEGHMYGLSGGILECVQIEGLQRKWKGGRYGHGQVILVDDLLLITTEQGELLLVRATPQRHEEVTRFPALEDKTWNNPALAGPYLLVRNHLEAACYQLPLLAE
jgi:outer membrane protein assembly factor BamB